MVGHDVRVHRLLALRQVLRQARHLRRLRRCLDDACPACGEPITDDMRARAKQAYLDKKKVEHDRILELAAAAKARRVERPAPVFPWDEPNNS